MDDKRRTGRTARMLQRAQELQAAGHAVYVIAANAAHAAILRRELPEETTINVETPVSCGNFDWHTLRLVGAHHNCAVLVDHYAIESHFAPMLKMLTMFDQPIRPSR